MNLEAKKKWLEALRSGHYFQIANVLYQDKAYCCLGVNLKVVEGYTPLPADSPVNGCFIETSDGNWKKTLHRQGVSDDAIDQLISMNDGGWTFNEIADWIEANL